MLYVHMGSSHSSEPSHSVEPDPEPLEVEEVEDDLQDPIDDFLETTMKWIFGVS